MEEEAESKEEIAEKVGDSSVMVGEATGIGADSGSVIEREERDDEYVSDGGRKLLLHGRCLPCLTRRCHRSGGRKISSRSKGSLDWY